MAEALGNGLIKVLETSSSNRKLQIRIRKVKWYVAADFGTWWILMTRRLSDNRLVQFLINYGISY